MSGHHLFSSRAVWCRLGAWLCCLCFEAAYAERPRLIAAAESRPPFAFQQNGATRGVHYDICKAVLAQLGYDFELHFYPWQRVLNLAQSGGYRAVLGITKGDNNRREQFLDFPAEPLAVTQSTLFYRRDRPFAYEGIHSLAGKVVGVEDGYRYSPDIMHAPYIRREPVATPEQNIRKLLAGRVDLVLMDRAVGLYLAKTLGGAQLIAHDTNPITGGKVYLAFARQPNGHDLPRRFAAQLAVFKQGAEYHAILQRYGLEAMSE